MTISASDLDSSAFNIQGVGFANNLFGPLVGCRDINADNYNIDTAGLYGPAGATVVFNTHSAPGDPNECIYSGCMDQYASNFFSTVYNGNTYYATTQPVPSPCDYIGCDDANANNYNETCGGYDLTTAGLLITTPNNNCCNYTTTYDCDPAGGVMTNFIGTGLYADYATALAACPICPSNVVSGCDSICSVNYDPLVTCNDGSCIDYTLGCMDDGTMDINQTNSYGTTIWPTQSPCGTNLNCTPYSSYKNNWSFIDQNGNQLNTNLNAAIIANNYDSAANGMDCSCEYHGCTDSQAINYLAHNTHEDGSCIYAGCTDQSSVGGVTTYNHPNPGSFYTNPIEATVDDGSCITFGCNPIDTPNVAPWNGLAIKETIVNDTNFEMSLESWNENSFNTQMTGLYYGHAGNFDDTVSPLVAPGNPNCGIPSTFANNLNNIVDYGNGLTGTCTVSQYLTHMSWEDQAGNFVNNYSVCTQGFANAWGPFDPNNWSASGEGHNDGFYLQRHAFPALTFPAHKTIFSKAAKDITNLNGIQDFALNPGFKRLVIHNQYTDTFIHSETDNTSPYYQLDMLDTLFQHASNFDCLSLKTCKFGSVAGEEVLDLTNWTNCGMVELVDVFYDEVNINHIDNPNCYSICIVNSDFEGLTGSDRNNWASGRTDGYSQDLIIDWASHTAGTIPVPTTEDKDESWRQAWRGGGLSYNIVGSQSTPLALRGSLYSNIDIEIGEHFPPQSPAFTGWDPLNGFDTGAADRFVPQYKLAPIYADQHDRDGQNIISTRAVDTVAWPEQGGLGAGVITGNGGQSQGGFNTFMFCYQGNIAGYPLGTIDTPGSQYHNGYGWVGRPSSQLTGSAGHGDPVSMYFGPGTSFPSYNPPDPTIEIDQQLTDGDTMNITRSGHIMQSRLVLVNLKNLRHVWLGPDWDPKYAMNRFNSQPTNPYTHISGFSRKGVSARGFSIKGCGNGQTVYVHTSGRAMEFKKRYGTNDTSAVNQFGNSIWSQEGQDFFLEYFGSNVVFVD